MTDKTSEQIAEALADKYLRKPARIKSEQRAREAEVNGHKAVPPKDKSTKRQLLKLTYFRECDQAGKSNGSLKACSPRTRRRL